MKGGPFVHHKGGEGESDSQMVQALAVTEGVCTWLRATWTM